MRILSKFLKDPLGFIRRTVYKTIILPCKYSKGGDYNAEKYWEDRFSKYGSSIRGVGDEGLSEEDNQKMYEDAAEVFGKICQKEYADFQMLNILEIGCGTGFYTRLMYDLGARKVTAIDITDTLFHDHRKNFPSYQFIKKDITKDKIEGKFDLIIMIDVIEHIVEKSKLTSAMENVKNSLSPEGIFVISPIMDTSKKYLFYVHSWSLRDIKERFPGYIFRDVVPFRDDGILVIKNRTHDKE